MNNLLTTEGEKVLWEENSSTEAEKNCSNSNEQEQKDIIRDIKTDSMPKPCDDIGKIKRQREACKRWYLKNKKSRKEYRKKHYEENKDYYSQKGKKWRNKNRKYFCNWKKLYRQTNRIKIREYHRKYCSARLKKDVHFKLTYSLRSRLYQAIRGNQKNGSAVKDLGCSIPEFKLYIERKWLDGMSWRNYGKNGWHMDHIIPLDSFDLTDRSQFLKACHYTNYQPLWASDNIRKGNKLSYCVYPTWTPL